MIEIIYLTCTYVEKIASNSSFFRNSKNFLSENLYVHVMRFFFYALHMDEIKFYSIIDSLPKCQRDRINLETVVDLSKQF